MAIKMTAETAKRVKALGINAKSEDAAREELLKILVDNGIEGMEEEDTATLIEIAESFVEDGASAAEVPDVQSVHLPYILVGSALKLLVPIVYGSIFIECPCLFG